MLQSPSCRSPTHQVSSHVIWFVYALPLPLLAGAVVRLAPSHARSRVRGAALAVCAALAASFIALPPSARWALQARYHLLGDTPTYLRLSTDGLSVTTSLALLMCVAWAGLGHGSAPSASRQGEYWIVSATLCVLLASNPLTLLFAWCGFCIVRVIVSLRNPDGHTSLVILRELGSLAALLAASQPLGLAGLSTALYPVAPQAMTGWLVAAASILRMGLYPLQTKAPSATTMRLAASLSGLYLLLRAAPTLPALAMAAAASAVVAAAMSARARNANESWGWLVQHILLLGILGTSVGPSGLLAGLAALVCVALCHPAIERLRQDRQHAWDLMALGALGGLVPTLGWSLWAALLGVTSYLGPRWILLALGVSCALCAWVVGRNVRIASGQQRSLWRDLFCWREAWRALPALALLLTGLRPVLLTYHGSAPLWTAIGSSAGLIRDKTPWPVALGLAVLTSASAALGWFKHPEDTTQDVRAQSSELRHAARSMQATVERTRGALAQIDLTLREHATLAWTMLAAVALILWLRGR